MRHQKQKLKRKQANDYRSRYHVGCCIWHSSTVPLRPELGVNRMCLWLRLSTLWVTDNSSAVANEFPLPRLAVHFVVRRSKLPSQFCRTTLPRGVASATQRSGFHSVENPAQAGLFCRLWTLPGSNRLPLPCHGSALPSELRARNAKFLYHILQPRIKKSPGSLRGS